MEDRGSTPERQRVLNPRDSEYLNAVHFHIDYCLLGNEHRKYPLLHGPPAQ